MARELQYESRLPKPWLQTLDANNMPSRDNQSLKQRSLINNRNAQSEVSGMLVTKNVPIQTMTQYDLVPEVIYNSLEIKMRETLTDLLGPTIQRQSDLTKEA